MKMDEETYKTMNQLPLSKVAVDEFREDGSAHGCPNGRI